MITLATLTLSKLVGTFALFLGLLGWQWISIRRTLRRDREAARREGRVVYPSPCKGEGGPAKPGRVGIGQD